MKSSKVKIREYIEFSGVEEYFTPEMELAMVGRVYFYMQRIYGTCKGDLPTCGSVYSI